MAFHSTKTNETMGKFLFEDLIRDSICFDLWGQRWKERQRDEAARHFLSRDFDEIGIFARKYKFCVDSICRWLVDINEDFVHFIVVLLFVESFLMMINLTFCMNDVFIIVLTLCNIFSFVLDCLFYINCCIPRITQRQLSFKWEFIFGKSKKKKNNNKKKLQWHFGLETAACIHFIFTSKLNEAFKHPHTIKTKGQTTEHQKKNKWKEQQQQIICKYPMGRATLNISDNLRNDIDLNEMPTRIHGKSRDT